ncbi:MAG: hypothetical protein U0235_07465 [Polyangiaceae bacterium]
MREPVHVERASRAGPGHAGRAAIAVALSLWAACGGVATSTVDGDASASNDGGGRPDGASGDGGAAGDGAITDGPTASDGGTPDAAYPCSAGGGPSGGVPLTYATCNSESECALVDLGCYCGGQPVVGVAKSFEAEAAACEATHAKTCALGCPVMDGFSTQDGKTPASRGVIKVRCVSRDGGPKRCESYVP